MYKIIALVFVIAAFLYACWLVIFRRNLPDAEGKRGFKGRFLRASVVFAVFLVNLGVADIFTKPSTLFPEEEVVLCYSRIAEENVVVGDKLGIMESLGVVWLTLNQKESDNFNQLLDKVVGESKISPQSAKLLKQMFAGLSYHKFRTTMKVQPPCYVMTELGSMTVNGYDKILKQIELLRKTQGKLDTSSLEAAKLAMAKDIQLFISSNKLWEKVKDGSIGNGNNSHDKERELVKEYTANKLNASPEAIGVASLILELEKLSLPEEK